METVVEVIIKFCLYVAIGFTSEILFSVIGIEKVMGINIDRRVAKKYREGFVSLYMIPIYGLGFFILEKVYYIINDWHIINRYLIWGILIALTEAVTGFIYKKTLKFYPWDYYKKSKYKIFKEGYTLWTLVPLWGVFGLLMEHFIKIINYVLPDITSYIM